MTRTKPEQARFDNMKDLGCIACILDKAIRPFEKTLCDIHHMAGRVKADSELQTVPLCRWHHLATGENMRVNEEGDEECIGPSWHRHRREFRKRYGTDAELIETVNKYLEPSE